MGLTQGPRALECGVGATVPRRAAARDTAGVTVLRTKRVLEDALIALGADRLAMRRRRGHALVLAYHNVVPDDSSAGDRSLHVGVGRFGEHIDALVRACDVVPLAVVLAAQHRPRSSRPVVAITFDDAYLGALTHGLDVLAKHGLPATVFVAPGRLGASFWWDALSGTSGLGETLRTTALESCAGDDARVRAWAAVEQMRVHTLPPEYRAATIGELDAAVARHRGLTLASHTWSHCNLSVLDDRARSDELRRPLDWLRERFPGTPAWIAYPYGLASTAVREAARAAGYEAGFLVSGGWMSSVQNDGLALPRLNIPAGLSTAGFRLRLGRP
ncbi:MAG TPA: polysaccharide deacetylase family protein [Gemmatimonadaceae bacterium]|jgi:peptidoglycan/xylan/chitin deacetylase (PgdA/CDA1 family)|nr:polysaccharide deacetylase family protein [Gemmatimonadaceae bacterium]